MATKVTMGGDAFASTVSSILRHYATDVSENVSAMIVKETKRGALELRKKSEETFHKYGGKWKHHHKPYAEGWTSTTVYSNYYNSYVKVHSKQGIIYNAYKPGLPHLLEHGHAKRGGGRVDGRPHIAPTEENIRARLQEKLKEIV